MTMFSPKHQLLFYLSDGKPRRPSDFDRDILGIRQPIFELLGKKPIWNNTPYCAALSELVKEGIVTATKDEDGWKYQMLKKPK